MVKTYPGNDYHSFVRNGDDAEVLQELFEQFTCLGSESSWNDSGVRPGEVNFQYEIVSPNNNALVVYDRLNKDRVIVTSAGLKPFTRILEKEISDRCWGFDYDTYQSLQHALEKNRDK